MSTIKVNEVRHLDNAGVANAVLASTGATTLRSTTVTALTAESVTVSGTVDLNGNTQIGNASTDNLTLTATAKGSSVYAGFTGEIRMWSGATAPTTWLICDGGTIGTDASSATYKPTALGVSSLQTLFDHLKTSFGNTGNESYSNNDTVKLPDFRGRIAIGVGQQSNVKWNASASNYTSNGTNFALGATGGYEDHVLTLAQLAAHNHTATSANNTTGITASTALTLAFTATTGTHTHTITDPTHSHAHTHEHNHRHDVSHNHTASGSQDLNHAHDVRNTFGVASALEFNRAAIWGNDSTWDPNNNAFQTEGAFAREANAGPVQFSNATISTEVPRSGAPVDASGNAELSTGAATSHAQATGITVNATSANNPAVTVADNNSTAATTINDTGHNHPVTVNNNGSDSPHNNLQPYLGINYIVKI